MSLIIRDSVIWKSDPADSTALLSASYKDIIPEIERLRARANKSTELLDKAAVEMERLRERCEAYKGQVQAGAVEIARMKAALEKAEPFLAAAAYTEQSSPPYAQGRACSALIAVRDALAK